MTGRSRRRRPRSGSSRANTFLVGNIFELSFWWSTIVTTVTLWLAGYLFLLPVTLIVWPAPWRNFSGRILAGASIIVGGTVAAFVFLIGLAV